ncbi:MAG: Fe-S cluster assembly protein SufD [Pseudomonadota bacterium]
MSTEAVSTWQGWDAALKRHPEQLATERAKELEHFLANSFPDRSSEVWKYSPTKKLQAFTQGWLSSEASAKPVADNLEADILRAAGISDAVADHCFVFVDGLLQGKALAERQLDGVNAEAGLSGTDEIASGRHDAITWLNGALASAALKFRATEKDRPATTLYFVHANTADSAPLASVRIFIDMCAHSKLNIVERFMPADGVTTSLTNSLLSVSLGANARLTHFRLRDAAADELSISELNASLASNAELQSWALDMGGQLCRSSTRIKLDGTDSSCALNGIYLGNNSDHIDNHLHIDHKSPNTRSELNFAGLAADKAKAIFNGKVFVHAGADGTDAKQSNRNLLLSDQAEIDTKPELEIYADDVKCAHGATTGELDKQAMFYLRARGLSERKARELLIRAFVLANLEGIEDKSLQAMFENALQAKLDSLLLVTDS